MKKLLNILKTLFSNQAVIDARSSKWFIPAIIFVLALFLPWIPTLSQGYTADCAALFLASGNQEIDKGIRYMMKEDYFKSSILVQKDGKGYYLDMNFAEKDYSLPEEFSYDEEYRGVNTKALYKGNYNDLAGIASPAIPNDRITSKQYDYYYDSIGVETTNVIDKSDMSTTSTPSSVVYEDIGRNTYLQVYFFPALSSTDDKAAQYIANFTYSVIFNIGADKKSVNFPHSYAIFGKDFINLAVYPLKSSRNNTQYSGAYSGDIRCGFNGKDCEPGTSLYNYLTENGTKEIDVAYKENFHKFAHEAGRPAYLKSVWFNVLFVSIAVTGSILVATVALIIINRRKVSLYRDTKWYQSLTEAILFSLTPAIIGMVIGFFNATYSIVAVAVCVLMRVFFVMSRICPPQENAGNSNKPLYQARS